MRGLLYFVLERGHRLQADQEPVREIGKARIPRMYFVRPAVRLRRVARQRISGVDKAEVIGCVAREVSEHVMKQIDHAGHDLQSIPIVISRKVKRRP